MRSDLRRLDTMARRRGLCAVHYARLWCAFCDVVWTGTDAEEEELGSLIEQSGAGERSYPYQPCARCGKTAALCLDCCEAVVAQTPEHPDLLSPEQRARYDVLIRYFRPRDRRHSGATTHGFLGF